MPEIQFNPTIDIDCFDEDLQGVAQGAGAGALRNILHIQLTRDIQRLMRRIATWTGPQTQLIQFLQDVQQLRKALESH